MGGGATVFLIDNHELVRRGIRYLLESHGYHVVGESSHCSDAGAMAQATQPDVIIFDPDTGDGISPELIVDLMQRAEHSRILILTDPRDPAVCARSILLGAVGFMYKHEPPEVLFKAIDKLQAGEFWLDRAKTASVLAQAVRRRRDIESVDAKIATLTKREREVIGGICEGLRNKQLADRLFISEATARNHLTSILDKLDLANRFDLVVFAFRHGLVERGREGWPESA